MLLVSLGLHPVIAAQTNQPIRNTESRPVEVERPSLPGFDQDLATLRSVGLKGDLAAYQVTADETSNKWESKDLLSYLCVLSEACEDLTSFDFGFKNVSKSHKLSEKYAEEALLHESEMPIAMQAFFVEHLNYVPSLGIQGATGVDWETLREDRARLWLQTWSDLAIRSSVNSTTPFDPPPLPDRKYITTRVIVNGGVDPSDISDPTVRDNYDKAWKEYYANHNQIMDQHRLQSVNEYFLKRAKKYLVDAYVCEPNEQDQLIGLMKTYNLSSSDQSEMISEIKTRTGVRN